MLGVIHHKCGDADCDDSININTDIRVSLNIYGKSVAAVINTNVTDVLHRWSPKGYYSQVTVKV